MGWFAVLNWVAKEGSMKRWYLSRDLPVVKEWVRNIREQFQRVHVWHNQGRATRPAWLPFHKRSGQGGCTEHGGQITAAWEAIQEDLGFLLPVRWKALWRVLVDTRHNWTQSRVTLADVWRKKCEGKSREAIAVGRWDDSGPDQLRAMHTPSRDWALDVFWKQGW